MQQLLDNLNSSFPDYHNKVNEVFRNKTRLWNDLYSDIVRADLYRGLLYIIKSFFESDKKRLFIQLPIDKPGKDEETKKSNLQELQEAIIDILYLATKDNWSEKLLCPDVFNTQEGDYYYCDDRVWLIKKSNTDGQLRPSCLNYPVKTSEARTEFDGAHETGIKLSIKEDSEIDEIERSRILKEQVKQINLFRDHPAIANYERCILVGSNYSCRKHPIGVNYIYSPIKFVSDYSKVENEKCDVLAFLWDRKYQDFERSIHNNVIDGTVKKIILIGKNIFDGFKEEVDNMYFPFTYREIFSYYYSVQFPRINFKLIPYPELSNKVQELNSLIPKDLDDIESNRILRYSLYPFLSQKQLKPDIKRYRSFLLDNFDSLTWDNINELVNWLDNATFLSKSPKTDEYVRIQAKKGIFDISLSESYNARLNAQLKKSNCNKNTYVIDAYLNDCRYVDIIKTLLKKGCLGVYYILSYFPLPSLKHFFEEELRIYNDEVRKSLLGVKMELTNEELPITPDLMSFYDASSDDLSMAFSSRSSSRQREYSCILDDETTVSISGDVICDNEICSIDDIYINKKDYLPCSITYYSTPSNFPQLMETYFNFPQGQTVDSFSQLWKQKMETLLREKYDGKAEVMQKDFNFLELSKLKQITRPTYKSLFPDEIRGIAETLSNMNVITIDDARFILAANTVVGTHCSKAKELKTSLMHYKLTGQQDVFMKRLLLNSASHNNLISIESVIKDSLIKGLVIDIKK